MLVELHETHIPRVLALVRRRKDTTQSREEADILREVEYRLECALQGKRATTDGYDHAAARLIEQPTE